MLCLDAPENRSLCSVSNKLCSDYARIIRHKTGKTERSAAIRVCGSTKDLVELPEASSPESYPSLETVVSGRLPDVLIQLGSSLSFAFGRSGTCNLRMRNRP